MAVNRHVVVSLDAQEYRALQERARQEDRDAHQQARHLVRQAIGAAPFSNTPAGGAGGSPSPAPATGPASKEANRG
jgi:hypothetical protein